MMRDTEKPAAPGDIRAFDLRNGKEVWRFHTIPHAGEFGADTWEGDSGRKSGGANPWGGVTIDEERGIAYAGLGAAVHDFYGGDRKGDNLFANSIVALDAQTGKRIWHYQLIHHDVWDYDLAAPPTLVNLQRDGRIIPAVVQTVKTGFVYVFDRVTGEPLFDIVEVPVPTDTDVPGEHLSPTQPIPVSPPPLSRQSFSPDELTNISSDAREFVLRTLKGLRYGTIFTPPSLGGTVSMPGYYGGLPWSGGSFDADTGVYYASSNNLPSIIKLEKLEEDGEISYRDYGYRLFSDRGVGVPLSELGIKSFPAGRPPWGSLSAVDISTGQILWQSTLGEYPELTQRGIPPTGTPNLGGNIVTGGGIVFIGATQDAMFRAFDKNTGEVLWKHPLATAAVATPSTYSVSGRQYVAINAGGGRFAPRSGDSFVAFTLPVRTK
jgi:quinoprotein glucose dehydrogenase